ncbi:MAG: hypothetical protein Q7S22_06305 [Candidatus Micrarchaeota archaeon]|nr:hypothetical protein [Candidatus Micrarchaeota archaeon]
MSAQRTVSVSSGNLVVIRDKFMHRIPKSDGLLLRYRASKCQEGKDEVNQVANEIARAFIDSFMKSGSYEEAARIAKKYGFKEEMKKAAEIYLGQRLGNVIFRRTTRFTALTGEDRKKLEGKTTRSEIRAAVADLMLDTYSKDDLKEIEVIRANCVVYELNFEEQAFKALKGVTANAAGPEFDFLEAGRVLGLNRCQLFKIAKEVHDEVKETDVTTRYRIAVNLGLVKQMQAARIELIASLIRDYGTTDRCCGWEELDDEGKKRAKLKGFELYLRGNALHGTARLAVELGIDKPIETRMVLDAFFELIRINPKQAENIHAHVWNYQLPSEVKTWAGELSERIREEILSVWLSERAYFGSHARCLASLLGWEHEKTVLETIASELRASEKELFEVQGDQQ